GAIHGVTQTPDGKIWFGSESGSFSRFDGEKFTTFAPEGRFRTILKMTSGADGVLWLGTEVGLIRFDGTNLVNATLTLAIRTWADSPTIEPDGSIWFGGIFGTGLHRFDPGAGKTGAVVQSFARQDGLGAGAVFSTFRAGGNLWIATFSGASRFDGTRFVN